MNSITVFVKVYNRREKDFQDPAPRSRGTATTSSWYLSDFDILELHQPPATTFEFVIQQCLEKCHISPLYAKLFALRDLESRSWINPNLNLWNYMERSKTKTNHTIETEFRIRFILRAGNKHLHRHCYSDDLFKSAMKENVVLYLFHQHRADFFEGRMNLRESSNTDNLKNVWKEIAAFDIMRLVHEMDIDIDNALEIFWDIERLFPKGFHVYLKSKNRLKRRLIQRRLFYQVKKLVDSFMASFVNCGESNVDASSFCWLYMQDLEHHIESDFSETYKLFPHSNDGMHCDAITIAPEHGILNGSCVGTGEKWCDFSEVTEVRIQANTETDFCKTAVVHLNQLDGKRLSLQFSSMIEAENCASCIDGYCQLFVDPCHYLCKNVCPATQVEELACFCHGPISVEYAEFILKEQPVLRPGDCLLRQSRESNCEYFINAVTQVTPAIVVKNFFLKRKDGMLGLHGEENSHIYSTLSSLIEAYKLRLDTEFNLNCLVHPKHSITSGLVVCRDNNCYSRETSAANPLPIAVVSIRSIKQADYKTVQHLGSGDFTDVRKDVHKISGKEIVVKQVFALADFGLKQHVEESFQESLQRQHQLNHEHIIQLIGTMSNMMVLEYASLGSIIEYFSSEKGNEDRNWRKWLLSALWQLTHACNYLEWKKVPHGNVRGKNILLCNDSPHIKLADSGVCTRSYGEFPDTQIHTIPVLPAPWLAYEFCKIDSQWPKDVNPTITGDKWSYATTVCEIADWGKLNHVDIVEQAESHCLSDVLKQRYTHPIVGKNAASVAEIPELFAEQNANEVKSLIQDCWNYEPNKRPSFKVILRELGMVMASDCASPFLRRTVPRESRNANRAISSLGIFEDKFLKRVRILGKGNFGSVDLCQYNNPDVRASDIERVAVKTPHEAINSLQMARSHHNEIKVMRQINNPYIVRLEGMTTPSMRLVMEYLPHGSLSNYLKVRIEGHNLLTSAQLLEFASQICQGMIALQNARIIHRDLALRNILLGWEPFHNRVFAKIADFGLAKILSSERDYYSNTSNTSVPVLWYAPECLRKNERTSFHLYSDIWSYGVTVWEVFAYGAQPKYSVPVRCASDIPRLWNALHRNERLPQSDTCPVQAYKLLLKCWKFEPDERINFGEILEELNHLIQSQ